MLTIQNEKFIRFENGCAVTSAELIVDNRSELPAAAGIEGRILYQGSVALIINEGKLAMLGSNGSWYINGEVIS